MLKPQDILVLLKLASRASKEWTFEGVADELDSTASGVHRSLSRAEAAGLYDFRHREVNRVGLLEFLVHGAKYVFPPEREGEVRGMPTAWAAPPLAGLLSASDRNVPVWPYAMGGVRGIALQPLHPIVPKAAERDPAFAELLTLVDAIRIGGARERALAAEELERRLLSGPDKMEGP